MKWQENPRWKELFAQTDLPSLCIGLRMSLNGASDPWPEKDVNDAMEYIQERLSQWRPSMRKIDEPMDEAVLQLCHATLQTCCMYREMTPTSNVSCEYWCVCDICESCQSEMDRLRAEIKKLQPVYDAALNWRRNVKHCSDLPTQKLIEAISDSIDDPKELDDLRKASWRKE